MKAVLTRHQPHWDWRAACNFIFGGAGAGLLVVAVLAGTQGIALRALVAAGLALVGLGLFCVWLEIGKPLRAFHVFLHLRTSWMSREAVAGAMLFLLGGGLVAGMHWRAWPTAVVAAVFLYCQARIIGGGRGIPAWREPMTVPLLVLTGLAEGAGLYVLAFAWQVPGDAAVTLLWLLVLVRWAVWVLWRVRLGRRAPRAALRAIDAEGVRLQWLGSALPLVLVALALSGWLRPSWVAVLYAATGLLVAATGAAFKFSLVTRAGFHQGFTLPHLPVRGVAR